MIDGDPDASDLPRRTLDYGSPLAFWRRQRLKRWSCIVLLLVSVGVSVAMAPKVYRRWHLLRMQEACLKAELPGMAPVYSSELDPMRPFIAAHPEDYHLSGNGGVARGDARWLLLSQQTDPSWVCGGAASKTSGTVFLHERYTPSGRRRLVVVEIVSGRYPRMWVRVMEPARWLGASRLVTHEQIFARGEGVAGLIQLSDAGVAVGSGERLYGGQPDPADASRFTIPFEMMGVSGSFNCRLGDDDRVRLEIADAEGYIARVRVALDAARAQRGKK